MSEPQLVILQENDLAERAKGAFNGLQTANNAFEACVATGSRRLAREALRVVLARSAAFVTAVEELFHAEEEE